MQKSGVHELEGQKLPDKPALYSINTQGEKITFTDGWRIPVNKAFDGEGDRVDNQQHNRPRHPGGAVVRLAHIVAVFKHILFHGNPAIHEFDHPLRVRSHFFIMRGDNQGRLFFDT